MLQSIEFHPTELFVIACFYNFMNTQASTITLNGSAGAAATYSCRIVSHVKKVFHILDMLDSIQAELFVRISVKNLALVLFPEALTDKNLHHVSWHPILECLRLSQQSVGQTGKWRSEFIAYLDDVTLVCSGSI